MCLSEVENYRNCPNNNMEIQTGNIPAVWVHQHMVQSRASTLSYLSFHMRDL